METVTIPKNEYIALQKAELMLHCLEQNGLDNWDGYGYAMANYALNVKDIEKEAA